MNPHPTENGEASALAPMFDLRSAPASLWRGDQVADLAAVLRHQLGAPLSVDLATLRGVTAEAVERLCGAAQPPLRTFHDLLLHPSPPVELLEMTKRFAKRARRERHGAVPEEVAGVLYFGSVLAARLRAAAQISNLSDRQVRRGVQWVLDQPWVDPETRALFATAGSQD